MDEFNHDPRNDNNENKNEERYMDKVRKGLAKLVDKDGFYIILFICICILGTTAVWVATRDNDDINEAEGNDNDGVNVTEDYYSEPSPLEGINALPDSNNSEETTDIDQENSTSETEDHSEVEAANIEKPTETKDDNQQSGTKDDNQKLENEQETNDSTEQVDVSPSFQQNRVISMILPTNGSIIKEFAVDKLVYSKTLEQWTTHNGVDITTREGSVVRAALDGVVASIKNDHELGIVITLDHGGGLTTVYASLSTDEMVKVGQNIKKGETISGVGKGVGFELAEGPHLHFEVLIDGKNVDPTQYIPNMR